MALVPIRAFTPATGGTSGGMTSVAVLYVNPDYVVMVSPVGGQPNYSKLTLSDGAFIYAGGEPDEIAKALNGTV